MAPKTTTREEFNARLAQSTEQVRQKRLTLEAQAAEMGDLIGRYFQCWNDWKQKQDTT